MMSGAPPADPTQPDAQRAIRLALQAMRRKDHREARRWAEQAARLDPSLEDAWLVLAALASPEASFFCLNKALEANPASPRARKAMHWAAQRLRQSGRRTPAAPFTAAYQPGVSLPLPALGDTQPVAVSRRTGRGPAGGLANRPRPALMWTAALLFVLLVAAITLAFNNDWVVMARSGSADLPVAMLVKPSLTPTNTPTNTPTATPTSTPTPTPTNTPTPTPTNTPEPTDTPQPTDTPEPGVGQYEPPISAEGRWIDVDLSEQMVYAFDGDQLVNSFLVSTGTWLHPTVIGEFHIYVKYRYTDMSGPGYYLPDVPYTMYFYKGYGLHGTYWHNNFGTPMSHGCVNLRNDDAAWLFDWASVGTLVNVHD
ncbi:MAG TPA: L,D-transpeptidase family protein [Anaerolinea sp.]|nr:L,D-transpeptidase family protein [Anaerolinea sp.]